LADLEEFKDEEAVVEKWLSNRSHQSRSTIATRAALRVLPLVFRFNTDETEHSLEERKRVALDTIRAVFVAWAANMYADGKLPDSFPKAAVGAAAAASPGSRPGLANASAGVRGRLSGEASISSTLTN
jgi:hypothetical protein